MSSQAVVTFVRIKAGERGEGDAWRRVQGGGGGRETPGTSRSSNRRVLLTDICAQLMDECIAKDAHSSPLGLDNMTVIIAQLKPTMWQSPPLPPKESCEASFTFDKPTH
ncbi:unnamed protein product [Closterium sp. NIES-65]|nr:unnamed protein product [Closterium sp. NIES-65]